MARRARAGLTVHARRRIRDLCLSWFGRVDAARYSACCICPGRGADDFCGCVDGRKRCGFLWFNAYPAQVFMVTTGAVSRSARGSDRPEFSSRRSSCLLIARASVRRGNALRADPDDRRNKLAEAPHGKE